MDDHFGNDHLSLNRIFGNLTYTLALKSQISASKVVYYFKIIDKSL